MKNKLLKKTIAAVCALSLLSGGLPVNLGEYSFNNNAFVAYAANPSVALDANGTLTLSGTFDRYIAADGTIQTIGYDLISNFSSKSKVKKVVCAKGTVFKGICKDVFYNFKATEIDLSNLTLDNVNDISGMFSTCSSLTKIDLSGLDTSDVTDMENLFADCSSLTELDLSGFNTSNVTDMTQMFYGCVSLQKIDLTKFDTSKVTDMTQMFRYTPFETLDLSSFDTKNVTSISGMFSDCGKLRNIYVSDKWNISKAIAADDADYMFAADYELVGGNATIYKGYRVGSEFACIDKPGQQGYLTDINKKATAPSVTLDANDTLTISGTFYNNFEAIRKYDGDTNVKKVICKPGTVFNGICSEIFKGFVTSEEIDLSNVTWDNVTDMSRMFWACEKLVKLDLTGIKTDQVENMEAMFYYCKALPKLDVSGFDTSNVTNMASMFEGCNNLGKIDVTGFDTSKVKNMAKMFEGCQSLQVLDLSSFDTKNVKDTQEMFDFSKMQTIYVSDKWDMSSVTSSNNMFSACYDLVGANGTAYDYSHIDVEYARIDKVGQNGYLSTKVNKPKNDDYNKTTTSAISTTTSISTSTTTESTATSIEIAKYSLGDVTGDSIIDGRDATDVLTDYAKTSTGQTSEYTEEQKKSADVNNDNIIDGRDATAILTYYAKTSVGETMTLEEYIGSIK